MKPEPSGGLAGSSGPAPTVRRRAEGRGAGFCRGALGALLLALAIGGCATVSPWQDARIEAEVKTRLVEQKDADLTRLGVQSRQRVVYLTGTVRSASDRALAVSLTREVSGVRRVVNALEVRPKAE